MLNVFVSIISSYLAGGLLDRDNVLGGAKYSDFWARYEKGRFSITGVLKDIPLIDTFKLRLCGCNNLNSSGNSSSES